LIALIIIAAVLLLMFSLFLFPVSFAAELEDELNLKVKYLFFNIPLGVKKDKKAKPKKREKKTSHKTQTMSRKQESKKEPLIDKISQYSDVIKELVKNFAAMLKYVVIKDLRINIKIASSDAAQTAIQYGGVCAVVYPLSGFIESYMRVDNRKIDVTPNFDGNEGEVTAFLKVQIKPLYVIATVISFLKCIIKLKQDGAKNE